MLIPGVVDHDGIGRGRSSNNDTIHCVGLVLGTLDVTVFLVMEVADREYREPSSLIRAHTMDEHEGGSEFATVTARNHIHHLC